MSFLGQDATSREDRSCEGFQTPAARIRGGVPHAPGIRNPSQKATWETGLPHARLALPFSLRIRPPLPGLFQEPKCDAAGPGIRVRHAEPLWRTLGSSRFRD